VWSAVQCSVYHLSTKDCRVVQASRAESSTCHQHSLTALRRLLLLPIDLLPDLLEVRVEGMVVLPGAGAGRPLGEGGTWPDCSVAGCKRRSSSSVSWCFGSETRHSFGTCYQVAAFVGN
jgi:hypothetical protein